MHEIGLWEETGIPEGKPHDIQINILIISKANLKIDGQV